VATAFAAAVAAATSAQSSAIGTGDGAALRSTSADLRASSSALVDAGLRQVQRNGMDGPGRRDEILSVVRSLTNEAGAALLVAGIVGSGASADEAELFAGAPEPHDVPKRPVPERKSKARVGSVKTPAADADPATKPAKSSAKSSADTPAARATATSVPATPPPPPPRPSAAELARRRRHEAQVDKAKAILVKTQREIAAARRAVDAAATRLARAEADQSEAAAALDTLASGA
jgi:hypothetical protein